RRIEGRTEESSRVLRIADTSRRQTQILELGEPARDRRARCKAGRSVEEGAAFAGHRIFVPAAEVEDRARRRFAEQLLQRHEGVIAVDYDPWTLRAAERRELVDTVESPPTAEQHLAHEDEVVTTRSRGTNEAFGEGVEGLRRNALDESCSSLLPSGELSAGAVKLTVAGEHVNRPIGP